MAFNIVPPLRAVQFVFGMIVLALAGYVAHWYDFDAATASPSQINILCFNGLWTMLITLYLAISPVYAPRFTHKYAILVIDAFTMIMWFAGFVALAAFLGGLTRCIGRVCQAAQASVVFAAFAWVLFVVTTFLAAQHVHRTRGTTNTKAATTYSSSDARRNPFPTDSSVRTPAPVKMREGV
ncbi:MAG: hypothetical protein MMC33_010405 [Icmadophila ericetorum]|nr:hypothetical protein [Icmadophila ericetorum]